MDIQENFICPICLQLAKNAVQASCCWKIYCLNCIVDMYNKFKHCPCCRSEAIKWNESRIARKVISEIKIGCPKCDKLIQNSMLQNHLITCPLNTTKCKHCDEIVLNKSLIQHCAHFHQKETKETIIRHMKQLQNKRESKIVSQPNRSSIMDKSVKQKDYFLPQINRQGMRAELGTTSKYFCGGKLIGSCRCCDGNCGPTNGENCDACMQLDINRWNLDKSYFINPQGYVCHAQKYGQQYHVACHRVYNQTNKGLFSKPELIKCIYEKPCSGCQAVAYSIRIGRYRGLY